MSTKKTRFCPSPTGLMHLGNLRTALLNFLLGNKSKGSFVLRIEDTDKERSKIKFAESICEDLLWMELNWDEGPRIEGPEESYFQSERKQIYESFYEKLIKKNLIYPCFATEEELKVIRRNQLAAGKPPRYPGVWTHASEEDIEKELRKGSKYVYRFRMPKNETIQFIDLVKGEQKFDSDDLDDFIVRKEDGSPTFMFANSIDDALMGINLVMRGDDHLSNTPRQIALLKALELDTPEYIHIALFTGDDGAPLSKRNGSLSVQELKKKGYFPLAVSNYLARTGHTISDNELKSLKNLSKEFDIKKISTSPSRFDLNQLNFWQKQVVDGLSIEGLKEWLDPSLEGLIPKDINKDLFLSIVRDNIIFPRQAAVIAQSLLNDEMLLNKDTKDLIKSLDNDFFIKAAEVIENNWPDWQSAMKELSSFSGKKGKDLFLPIRVVLTGDKAGPELDHIANLLGKERVINRLNQVVNL